MIVKHLLDDGSLSTVAIRVGDVALVEVFRPKPFRVLALPGDNFLAVRGNYAGRCEPDDPHVIVPVTLLFRGGGFSELNISNRDAIGLMAEVHQH